MARGPTVIRTENGQLAAYIYVDIRDRDIGSYVAEARQAVANKVKFPAGLLRRLERPVRIYGARRGEDGIVVPVTLLDHLPAALSRISSA